MPHGRPNLIGSDPAPSGVDRYRSVFNLQHQFLAVLSPDGIVLEINDLPLRVGGVRREAVVGRPLWEGGWWRDHPEMRAAWPVRLKAAAAEDGPVHHEGPFKTGTGELRYALDTITAVRDAGGRLDYFIVQGRDITDRVQAELALREKDALLEMAGQMAHMGAWTVDFPGAQLTWSDEVCRIHDMPLGSRPTPDEALAFYHPDARPEIVAAIQACHEHGTPFDKELQITTRKGCAIWVRVMGEAVRALDGTVKRIQGAIQDITLPKLARDAVIAGEERFKFVAQATNDAIWDWDVVQNKLWWSEGFTRLFGYELDEVEEGIESWVNLVHPDDRATVVRDFYRAVEGAGDIWVSEYRFLCKDGHVAQVLDRGRIIRDSGGKCVRMVGGMTDFTAYKQAEMELARSNRALKMLSDCNERLIHAADEHELVAEICRLAVEKGGYRMAWVGYAQNDAEKTIKPMSHAGAELGYLSEIILTWSDLEPRGLGPAGQAIRSGAAVVAKNIQDAGTGFHWLGPALRRGYQSVICLPLKEETRTFGILALYSGEVQPFAPEEVRLLQELADDLAFGIHHLRSQGERRQLEATVLKVASSISSSTGREFFEQLSRNMAEALGAHAGFVARLLPGESQRVRTIAAVVGGEVLPNFEYSLVGTPCEKLTDQEEWVVPSGMAQQFPDVRMLQEMKAEGYVGCRLANAADQFVGLLFVIFQQPLEKTEFVTTTLKIFATRAAAELERQESDRRIRQQASLLDHARDAIVVRDLDNKIIYWNKGAERIYGWTQEEVLGRDVAGVLYRDTFMLNQAMKSVVDSGDWSGELQHVGKDGRQLIMEGRWTLMRDKAGQPQSILAINTDVTEKKKLEQQFLRAQRMESIGTLAGGIAHDLNNVLSPITMAIDLLKMSNDNPEHQELYATIADSARRGADMVRQVLSFARGMEGQRIQIQVKHLIKEIEKITRDTFPKSIRVRTKIAPDLLALHGDPTQLHQVLLNLCVNARDALPDGGDITISARNIMVHREDITADFDAHAGLHVLIEVVDTGTGIPQSIIEKVFDPFFTTKEIGKGTGLGLSTSLAIVKSHEGFIRLESLPGVGTHFSIFLPAWAEDGRPLLDPTEGVAPRGAGEWILVVDDEELIRQIARQTLQAYGYHVLVACDGVEALALYRQNRDRIAAVVTDMMMPVMDGATTIRRLMEMNPGVKIIAASGIAANDQLARNSGTGVKHFLAKPYSVEALLAALRETLDSV